MTTTYHAVLSSQPTGAMTCMYRGALKCAVKVLPEAGLAQKGTTTHTNMLNIKQNQAVANLQDGIQFRTRTKRWQPDAQAHLNLLGAVHCTSMIVSRADLYTPHQNTCAAAQPQADSTTHNLRAFLMPSQRLSIALLNLISVSCVDRRS